MPDPVAAAERTTVGTNVVLALAVFGGVAWLVRATQASPLRRLWVMALSVLGTVALAGGAAHSARIAGVDVGVYWRPSYFVIACSFALIFIGTVGVLRGYGAARRALLPTLAATALYFAATWHVSNDERVLAAFGVVTIGFSVMAFGWLGAVERRPGAAWVACGLGLLFVAAACQLAIRGTVQAGWTFDHNGIAHLVVAVAVAPVTAGLYGILRAPRRAVSD